MDMSQINALTQTASSQTARKTETSLGKDEFMKILISQLQNQDPLSPMEDKDFIAQMAQFSMLEQMQSLNSGFGFGQATSLVGKNVLASMTDADGTAQALQGPVTSVIARDGISYLEVGGYFVPYNQDIVVYEGAAPGALLPDDPETTV